MERLRNLKAMLVENLITEQEYKTTKAEILRSLGTDVSLMPKSADASTENENASIISVAKKYSAKVASNCVNDVLTAKAFSHEFSKGKYEKISKADEIASFPGGEEIGTIFDNWCNKMRNFAMDSFEFLESGLPMKKACFIGNAAGQLVDDLYKANNAIDLSAAIGTSGAGNNKV
ncbi:hypothetical protein HK100_004030 [Physocladia obscura]|uniref:Uncharacterized protein n=1 Tax=Physocladia obscura TaxID=109957 RepID=A0AAD5STN3_9FUNG|nr:hypothetical protein HK100_004030 [Physocladia obscura]